MPQKILKAPLNGIALLDALPLLSHGVVTVLELRKALGLPAQASVPVDIRILEDGTTEQLFADGKRLLIPVKPLTVKNFDDL